MRDGQSEFVDADYALGRYPDRGPASGDQEGGLRRLRSGRRGVPALAGDAVWIGNT
jgi:hypothetical protein